MHVFETSGVREWFDEVLLAVDTQLPNWKLSHLTPWNEFVEERVHDM